MAADNTAIYSATYSNVPVYEYNVSPGVHIMRRRVDNWINATHILKAAGFDKPARTRILEREVQKGVHEKVQGGYGKYQGTWIPLGDGRNLAQRNGVLESLLPIFDFVPGDFSPPAAPKHATATASKPRAPRQTMAKRLAAAKAQEDKQQKLLAAQPIQPQHHQHQQQQHQQQQQYDLSQPTHYIDDRLQDDMSVMSESILDDDFYGVAQYSTSRKRKRDDHELSMRDIEHQNWADNLLDYFMLADSIESLPEVPAPPPNVNLDNPIDDRGHTALHWASAMGDLDVVRSLVDSGARTDRESKNLETPLMRSVMFTNNYDRQTMGKLIRMLFSSVTKTDWFGSTVFHHIAATTSSKSKYVPARYYLDTIINALGETWIPDEITKLLDRQDQNGDTAIHIAARHGARKCVRSLLARNASTDIRNVKGETADEMIRELNARRGLRSGGAARIGGRDMSSSPFGPDRAMFNGDSTALIAPTTIQPQYRSETANSLLHRIGPTVMAKVRSLALAYEAEYEEKELEANENENVVKKRREEIDLLTKQAHEQHRSLEEELVRLAATGESLEQEELREQSDLAALEGEAISLLELEQRDSLGRAMQSAGLLNSQRHVQTPMGPPPPTNGDHADQTRQSIAARVQQAQLERQKLTHEIVRSMSTAGIGERHNDYKRLIHGALRIKENEIDSMLDEILGQLEEDRRDPF